MHGLRGSVAGAGLLAVLASGASATTASAVPDSDAPAVLALVGDEGLYYAHDDFRLLDRDLRPPPAIPVAAVVPPPPEGATLDTLRDAGHGVIQTDTLTWVAGTRVLAYAPDARLLSPDGPHDLLADTRHGTAVASAAARANGTAWLLVVVDPGAAAWQWVAEQPWIDVASTSTIVFTGYCDPVASAVGSALEHGLPVFSAAGNGGLESAYSDTTGTPASLEGVYRVGGADAEGYPWGANPGRPDAPATHPYDTNDLFEQTLATADGVDAVGTFRGTSFATPRTAARAVGVIQHARALVGDHGIGRRDGRLAAGSPSGTGLLQDGFLNADELRDTLRHQADRAYADGPTSHPVEGYGFFSEPAERRVVDALVAPVGSPRDLDDDLQTVTTAPRKLSSAQSSCPRPQLDNTRSRHP